MKTRMYAAILTALLIMAMAGSAMCTATYDPIADNGMKAYVWNSNEEDGWKWNAISMVGCLSAHGFNVTHHIAPNQSTIYQNIEDEDVKIYWGMGHGGDTAACTGIGTGSYFADSFGEIIESRDSPLTIGFFQHCGDPLCYTPGHWLQESTQGNDNVVAQRYYGEGWCDTPPGGSNPISCEDCLALVGTEIQTMGGPIRNIFWELMKGHNYSDSVDNIVWTGDEGRKQGNRDLRYPQFCGDVNYDRLVDQSDATLLQNHLIDPEAYPIHSVWDGDVDGNGVVNQADYELLSNHVLNATENPLNPAGWFIYDVDCNPWDDDGLIEVGEIMDAITMWENQQSPYPNCPAVTASDIMDLITVWQNQ